MFEFTPVDYVSQAVVALSLSKTSSGQAFHLCDPIGTKVNDITQWINDFGYPLQKVDYATWLKALIAFVSENKDHGLSPFLFLSLQPTHSQSPTAQSPEVICDNRFTLAALAETNIQTPVANEQLLHTYLLHMVKNKFIQAPGTFLQNASGQVGSD